MRESRKRSTGNGGLGCWLIGTTTVFITMILTIGGLFLPPFDLYDRYFGVPFVSLTTEGASVTSADGFLTVTAATYPGPNYGVRLTATPLLSFESTAPEQAAWITTARAALPPQLALQSAVYRIETTGTRPLSSQIALRIPATAASSDLLDLYGWYENPTTQTGNWRFIPATVIDNQLETTFAALPDRLAIFQAAPVQPTVLVSYDVTQSLQAAVATIADYVSPGGLQPTMDGRLTGSLAAGFSTDADYGVIPLVRDFSDPRALDTVTVAAIISNPSLRSAHIRELVLTASSYDGLAIDYRGLTAEHRENFSDFIAELGQEMDRARRLLVVVVPEATPNGAAWNTAAYDWRIIGAAADYVQINFGLNPRTYARGENQQVERMLRYAVQQIERTRVLMGLTTQSVREIGGTFTSIGYDSALAALGDVEIIADNVSETNTIEPGTTIRARLDGRQAIGGYDETIQVPTLDYVDDNGNQTARMWLTTGSALRFRTSLGVSFAIGGAAFDDLMHPERPDSILIAIADYRAQMPTLPITTDWELRWEVINSSGETLQSVTTDLASDLVLRLDAPDGNYAVNPRVVLIEENIENISRRSGAQVALFRPTPTPTPLPTATPTPTPTVTPTPAPIIATAVPAGAGNPGSSNPLATGRIVAGTFEYGGHATSATSSVAYNAMRSAGMNWIKVQIRYFGPGSGAGEAIAAVQNAKANGFKVLIGTVGDSPGGLGNGGQGYIQAYANWLAQIASAGADAIEVWNEPNLEREWPRGQISGAYYAEMLRASYNAIKSANGATMVISGAPAPTGAEALDPDGIMNDDKWMRQMVEAGGLNYTDCVGIHYNEGIVSPTQTSGDPRNYYYTRYFPTLLDVYWGIIGGQRPLCITEIGYLTPEGYPPLPAFFAWAQNVTVAQQAAWLAQAAAYSSQTGRVRLFIVWNVDFRVYGSDPQAGYAIIRPDGSCPACSALAGAR